MEFWSNPDPGQGSCILNDYPSDMDFGPTANLVSGLLVACMYETCEIYQEGSWQHLQNTITTRTRHSSATMNDSVLLIGGTWSNTTEWIPVNGSSPHLGPFSVRHGQDHCTIQTSDNVLVVTGGVRTEDFVTEYQLANGKETPLTSMGQPRFAHACSVYRDTDGQQVTKRLYSCKYCNVLQQFVYFLEPPDWRAPRLLVF